MFPYSRSNITNKETKAYDGNTKDGIKMVLWKKGSTDLPNKMTDIFQIVDDMSPDIIALTEAQLKQDIPLQEVCIPKYILFTDGLYKYGRTSRTVVYIHQQISVKVRDELQHPDTSTVPLTINRGREKIIY